MLEMKVLELPAGMAEVDYGTQWLKEKNELMLKVPSAVMPYESEHEFNLILNPLHDDYRKIFIAEAHDFSFDGRFEN